MGSETFQKRERERKRQERAAQRRERRDAKRNNEDDGNEEAPVSAEALMEQFRVLSEQHASGEIDTESYEAEKAEIFVQLGLSDPFES